MPWISRGNRSTNTGYWLLAMIAAVAAGILIGYQQWGTTAAVVSLVEREMAITQAQIKVFEKRLSAMELRFASGNAGSSTSTIANGEVEESLNGPQKAVLKNQITTSTAEGHR